MAKGTASKLTLIERTKAAALARNTARLAELVALIRRRMTDVVESFYDMGEALREVVEHKLYAAAGHASFKAFLAAERLLSARQAAKLIAVVRKVPREQALALGQERAYALVAYTNATPEDDSPEGLLSKNAVIGSKTLQDASLRDIEAATKATRAKEKAKRPATAAEREKSRADEALKKRVRSALRDAGIGRVEVTLGREVVTVRFSRAQAVKLSTDA